MGEGRAVLRSEGGVVRNTPRRYGAVAILLHWGMALLLVALLALGWFMTSLPDAGYDLEKITLILVHKAMGILALFAVVARVAWRSANPLPGFVDGMPQAQQVAARFVQLCFYALMFALPLTGWLMSSAGGYPSSFFGLFELPDLIAVNEYLFHRFIDLHKWLGWALVALVVVHVAAALQHHFGKKDGTLEKMWL